MSVTVKLAIPTDGQPGLDATRAGHFGHCECFTVVDIVEGEIKEVSEIANPPHEEGGCMRPVNLLQSAGVNAIVAAGMGGRPLMGFNQAGITVYFDNQHLKVEDAVNQVISGEAAVMSVDQACQHHH